MRSNKYRAKRTVVDGITFDSKREAEYYVGLKLRKAAGSILYFLRQVAFDLPGGTKYRCDFLEFWADGTVHIVDVKGYETKDFIRSKKQVEALYPVKIEVMK